MRGCCGSFREYVAEVRRLLEEYSAIIADMSLEFLEASPSEGFIRGSIVFDNGYRLSFFEYIVVSGGRVERLKYRYHLEDDAGRLVFRYDNAPHHRGLPTFPHHKHLPDGRVVAAEPPSLRDVLEEAVSVMR